MKVVVLMGSPRKKDSYKIVEQLREEVTREMKEPAREMKGRKDLVEEELEWEYVMLSQLHIEECKGCEMCLLKGEQHCPIKDETQKLVRKMVEADGIVFVSPVYACQVSGTFKKMVDRLSYLFHRPELVAKPAVTVLTTAGGGIKPTKSYLKLVADGWACHLDGQLQVACTRYFKGRWGCPVVDERYKAKVDSKIKKVAQKFSEDMRDRASGKMPKPSLHDVYIFNGLRSKTYTSKADFRYWKEKGWIDGHYYYETKLPLGSGLIEKGMNQMLKMLAEKMGLEQGV